MLRTLAAIAVLGFSGAASAAPADDSEVERTTLLRIIGEGTVAIAAAAAAVRVGYADPEVLIKIRDEGLKRIRDGVKRQGSSAHCDTAI
jgi:hypothetical protein